MAYYVTEYASPIGRMLLASDGTALCGLWLEGQKHYAAGLTAEVTGNDDLPIFTAVKAWLDDYFAGKRPSAEGIDLAPLGSTFQQKVWRELQRIPYGETVTYGELAKRLNSSARAVGGAVGRNPISVAVPCHRVVGANSALTGYAGGIDKKIWLLEHEKTR